MPTAVPDSIRGSNATITMSREDLMAMSVKKLKDMLKERDLPAGHAKKSTLVDRFLKGKKKAPKSNAERMASSRANRTQAQKNKDTDRNTDRMAVLRSNKAYRDKENKRKAESQRQQYQEDPVHRERVLACKTKWNKVVTSNVNIIKDVTRGDLNTPLWKRPGIDYHTEDFEQHWQAALHNLYLNANIGWDIEFKWDLAFIHMYDRMMNEIAKMMAARERVKELRDKFYCQQKLKEIGEECWKVTDLMKQARHGEISRLEFLNKLPEKDVMAAVTAVAAGIAKDL